MVAFAHAKNPAGLSYPSKRYAPLNQCAYCDATDNLSDEHIIAFGLGGELVLPKGSCEKHRKATSKVEDFVLRRYLCPLRSHLGLPSRKLHLRPDGYPLILKRGAHSWKQKVSLQDHPGMVRFVIFDPPGRVAGRPPVQETYSFRLTTARIFPDIDQRLARLGADGFEDIVNVNAMSLARVIAKIAHAFAIAELGVDAFEKTYLNDLISDGTPDWTYWVGGYDRGRDVCAREIHELRFLQRGDELSVIVHLFVPYCSRDAYEVIVGQLRPGIQLPQSLVEELTVSDAKNILAVGQSPGVSHE